MYASGMAEPVPPMVSLFTPGWSAAAAKLGTAPTSATWEAANRAVYYPLLVPTVTIVRRFWWANGATTTGGATVEAGVYADGGYKPGGKIVSGSATQGTASQVQFVDVTDTTLAPGLYWLALSASSATNTTIFRTTLRTEWDAALRFEQSSANPLPATATPAESSAAHVHLFGFATTASP
jgi:hypothetical protein